MFLKKLKTLSLISVLTLSMGLVACKKDTTTEEIGEKEEQKTYKISLILDEGGVNDQSFNQSAWEGALKAKEEYGVEVNYLESKQESDYFTNVETAIDGDADLIIGVGFKLVDTIEESAKLYPEEKFAIIDGSYDEIPENVQPILFNEEQAGYAVGLIAGKMTESNTVGFIGGMDIPSVTNFVIGYEKALKEINPEIKVLKQYANSFTDASKGKVIAEQMVSNNADIVFTAGGGVNSGVFEACKEKSVKAIGVDMPSNYIAPEIIITSALKNVGTGVQLTIKDLVDGNFKGGQAKTFDLSNGGVGYELTDLLPQEVIDFVNEKIK